MNTVIFENIFPDQKYVLNSFYKDGKPLEHGCRWGMTLRAAGSMRFRWAENNVIRDNLLDEIAGGKTVVPVELDHTKDVYSVKRAGDTFWKIGDGIITDNAGLVPVVTVADCMPLFLYDSVSEFFGVVHSGWKGTGIVAEAVKLAEKEYGSNQKDISVAIGPHIRSCCYVVNQERADYFSKNFSPECVVPVKKGECVCKGAAGGWNNGSGQLYRLSLERANLAVLEKSGILQENIVIAKDCTCCNSIFGSNRRETSLAPADADKNRCFTVQAAFTIHS